MELLKLKDAAHQISISYPTLKQWIYHGKIRSVKTPGGHHRIPQSEIERLAAGRARAGRKPSGLNAISGRNKLRGTVTHVQLEGLLAQVTIDIGGQSIVSIITSGACKELDLKPGT